MRATETEIAGSYKVTVRTFQRDLCELTKAGLIRYHKDGRENIYVFLDPEDADLNGKHGRYRKAVKKRKATSASCVRDQKATPKSCISGEKATPASPKRVTPVSRIPQGVTKRGQNAEETANRTAIDSREQRGPPGTLPAHLAARFLKQLEFPLEDKRRLLRKYKASRILEVRRRFNIKAAKGYPKNPRGLVLTMLAQDEISQGEASAASFDAQEAYEKRKRRGEVKKADRDIHAWRKAQPDAEELLERAEKDVAFMAGGNGSRLSKATIPVLLKGFLWRVRKQREREARLEVPSLAGET